LESAAGFATDLDHRPHVPEKDLPVLLPLIDDFHPNSQFITIATGKQEHLMPE
jgi:hypothetical protein